jgi:hypothetical protein
VIAHVGLGENLMAPGVIKCSSLVQDNVLVVKWPTPASILLQSTATAASYNIEVIYTSKPIGKVFMNSNLCSD